MSVVSAMEWLFEHSNDEDIDSPLDEENKQEITEEQVNNAQIKCYVML